MTNALKGLILAEAVCGLALLVMLWLIVRFQAAARRRADAETAVRPVAQEALSIFMGGNPDFSALRGLAKAYPGVVEQSILGFQAKLGGSERERLAALAINLGFVDQWCLQAKSPNPQMRCMAHARIAASSHSPAIRRMADQIGIRISGLCSFLFWPYPLTSNDVTKRERGLELAGKIAEAAHDLGVENVLVVPGAVHIPWRTDHEPVPNDVCDKRARDAVASRAGRAPRRSPREGARVRLRMHSL
jgi:hypothetical protein